MLVYDPGLSKERIRALGARKVELEEIFRESDILSLHAPSIEATHKLSSLRNGGQHIFGHLCHQRLPFFKSLDFLTDMDTNLPF